MNEDISEAMVVYEATMSALVGVRRILLLISGLIGLFLFHMFLWYLCWDHARIDARQGVIIAVQRLHEEGKNHSGSVAEDQELIDRYTKESEEINSQLASKAYEVPLVGMPVSGSDFSIAILLLANALLFWLLFFQRKFGACLKQLTRLKGWGIVISSLQYHFLLVGHNASPEGRRAAQGLIYGIPVVGSLQIVSDLFDLFAFWGNPTYQLAFLHNPFVIKMFIRLLIDIGLVAVLALLATRCYREYKQVEEDLTKHLTDYLPAPKRLPEPA